MQYNHSWSNAALSDTSSLSTQPCSFKSIPRVLRTLYYDHENNMPLKDSIVESVITKTLEDLPDSMEKISHIVEKWV